MATRVPLSFLDREVDSGGTRWPIAGQLHAFIDEEPQSVGSIDYHLSPRGAVALIEMIFVRRGFRRYGVATALMDELRRRHPKLRRYETPELLDDGRRFFAYYGPWRRDGG